MKTKKPISVLLALLMALTLIPLSVFTASAQECLWDFYIGSTPYTKAQLGAGTVPGLSFSGSTLTMNNYEGTSIAAIPGGVIGDDDSPVLNIRLEGDNKLTGGYFKYSYSDGLTVCGDTKVTGDDCFFGALVSEPRAGGSGYDSKINISGTGTLDITLAKNYSYRIRTVGGKPTAVEKKSDVDIKGVFCGDFNVLDGTVNITVGGNGITAANVTGAEADVSVTGGVLDIAASVNKYRKRSTSGIRYFNSTCAVYGVNGDVILSTNRGYFASELASVITDSSDVTAVNGSVSYKNAYGALYLSAPAGKTTYAGTLTLGSGTWQEGISYKKFAFSDAKYVYEAYGPVNMEALRYNSSLSEIYAHEVTEKMTFPEIGEDQLFENNYTLYSDDGFFMRELSYKSDSEYDKYGNAQSWNSDTWTKYEECDETFLYEFHAKVVPAAGRWYVPEAGEMDNESADNAFADLYAQDGFASPTGIFAFFKYDIPTITKQPAAVLYSGDSEVSVEATGADVYEWWMEVYDGDTLVSEFAVGNYYGDMDGFDDTDTDTMRLGGFAEDDAVPGTTDFTYGDASKVLVYCKVRSVGKTVTSNKSEYKLFEDSVVTIKTQPVNAAIDNTGKAKFTVVAEGDGLTYDWYMNDSLISSASNKSGPYGFSGYNTASLTVTVESEMGAGILSSKQFRCVVRDAHGGYAESDKVKIIDPAKAPVITQQPVNCEYVKGGNNPQFKVTATGDDLTYQWYWGTSVLTMDGPIAGYAVSGGKTNTLTINSKGLAFGTWADKDVYCVITNANGKVTTNKVKIVEITPKFTTQPVNCTAALNNEGSFKAVFEKTNGVTYQWYTADGTALKDGSAPAWTLSGTKTDTLKVTAKTPFAYTTAEFYCEATYQGVKFKSNTAKLVKPHDCAGSTTKIAGKAATCTAAGVKEHYKCTMCEKLYADAAATKALAEKDLTVAALGHSWDAGKVTTAATCKAAGIKTFTCSVCGTKKTESIAKLTTHTYKDGKCTVCDAADPNYKATPDYKLGDIDANGKVEAADARLALRASVGLEKYNAGTAQFLAADVDLDNKITASDARLILRFAVGLEKKLGK